jgi:hypothetical protein
MDEFAVLLLDEHCKGSLETGSCSQFQGFYYEKAFCARCLLKNMLTRMREANIYNNMLYSIKSSTQEYVNYIILYIR